MDWKTIANIVVAVSYGTILIVIIFAGGIMAWHEYVGRRRLRSQLEHALQENIDLPAHKVQLMTRGLGLNSGVANRVVFKMLGYHVGETHERIYELAKQLEKVEPFSDLPEEIRPIVVRLSELCEGSSIKSDNLLIEPVRKSLFDFEALKNETKRSRKFTVMINLLGVVTFILGAYATFTAPNMEDLKTIVINAIAASKE